MHHDGGLVRNYGNVSVGLHDVDIFLLHSHGVHWLVLPAKPDSGCYPVQLLRNSEPDKN